MPAGRPPFSGTAASVDNQQTSPADATKPKAEAKRSRVAELRARLQQKRQTLGSTVVETAPAEAPPSDCVGSENTPTLPSDPPAVAPPPVQSGPDSASTQAQTDSAVTSSGLVGGTELSPDVPPKLSIGSRTATMSGDHGICLKTILEAKPFKDWVESVATQTRIEVSHIHVQSLDMFGPKVGFIKFKADVKVAGKDAPGIVFMRGGAVVILVILHHGSNRFALVVRQARVPVCLGSIAEIPAGMLDSDGSFSGAAAKEMKEECSLDIKESDLVNLTELAYKGSYSGIFPSCGASDEFNRIFLYQKIVTTDELERLNGKLTGVAAEGEIIKLQIVPLDSLWKTSPDANALAAVALFRRLEKVGLIPEVQEAPPITTMQSVSETVAENEQQAKQQESAEAPRAVSLVENAGEAQPSPAKQIAEVEAKPDEKEPKPDEKASLLANQSSHVDAPAKPEAARETVPPAPALAPVEIPPVRYSKEVAPQKVDVASRSPSVEKEMPSALGKFLANEAKLGALAALRNAVMGATARKVAQQASAKAHAMRKVGAVRPGAANARRPGSLEEQEVSSDDYSPSADLAKKSEELKRRLLSSNLRLRQEGKQEGPAEAARDGPQPHPPLAAPPKPKKKKRRTSTAEAPSKTPAAAPDDTPPPEPIIHARLTAEQPLPGAHTRAKAAPRSGVRKAAPPAPPSPAAESDATDLDAEVAQSSPEPQAETSPPAEESKKKKKTGKVKVKVKRKKKDGSKQKKGKAPKEASRPRETNGQSTRRNRSPSLPKRSPSRPILKSKSRSRVDPPAERKRSPEAKRKRSPSERRKKKSPSAARRPSPRRRSPSRKLRRSPSRKKESPHRQRRSPSRKKQSPPRHQKRSPSRRRKQSPSRNRKRSPERRRSRSRQAQGRRSRSNRHRPRSRSQQRRRSPSRKKRRSPSRRRSPDKRREPSRRRNPSRRRSPSRRRKDSPRKCANERRRSPSRNNRNRPRSWSRRRRSPSKRPPPNEVRVEVAPNSAKRSRSRKRSPSVDKRSSLPATSPAAPNSGTAEKPQEPPAPVMFPPPIPAAFPPEPAFPPAHPAFPPQPPVFPPAGPPTMVPPTMVPPTMPVPSGVPMSMGPASVGSSNPAAVPAGENAPADVDEQIKRFEPGNVVTLTGLLKNANLNGQKGVVLPADGGTGAVIVPGTVKVKLDLGPEVAVKPQNLIHFQEDKPPEPLVI